MNAISIGLGIFFGSLGLGVLALIALGVASYIRDRRKPDPVSEMYAEIRRRGPLPKGFWVKGKKLFAEEADEDEQAS
jgi:hypothetical protein